MAKRSSKRTFIGSQGHELAARLDLPDGKPLAYVLFAHCFTCSKDIFAASRIAGELAKRGLAVLRFDFTGLGASEGEFANTNFSSNVEDLIAAAAHMRDTLRAPSIMVGHSLGGAAVLSAAAHCPDVLAVATIGAPFDAGHVVKNFGAKLDEINQTGVAKVSLAGRIFTIKKQFLEDIEQHKAAARIGALKKPLLIFHAPHDQVVGIENAGEIFRAAKHPKSFVSLDDADHLLSAREDAVYVADVLSAWVLRYIEVPATVPEKGNATTAAPMSETTDDNVPDAAVAPAPGVVRAIETGYGKFQQHVVVDGHQLLADEPESYGGMATGPSPYDYLSIALASCTSMTLRLYAARKEWALKTVQVDVQHEKIHAKDCADCGEGREGRVDRFSRQLTLTGDLSAQQRARLAEIADRCPVHRTLEQSSVIVTRLV